VLDRAADSLAIAQNRSQTGTRGWRASRTARGGFSLLELVIVLAVTLILTSLMLPALTGVRLNVYKVISSSHLRQIGFGITMYARDYPDRLPYSELLSEGLPLELMAAHIGDDRPKAWDGIGLLYSEGYIEAAEIFYCPGHEGEHTFNRYQHCWNDDFTGDIRVYTNYHYCGDREWEEPFARRRLEEGESLVLATDGFRTQADLNHEGGINMLRADGSVRWHAFSSQFLALIPRDPGGDQSQYAGLWKALESLPP
jgi:prepilin-type N-terminal cleavage/methylation domain-containing protein/prepilin-type processing-associated H-X9-DG protein